MTPQASEKACKFEEPDLPIIWFSFHQLFCPVKENQSY